MLFEQVLHEAREGITEAGVEYYTDVGKLRVKLSHWSTMSYTDLSLEDFWKKKSKDKLVEQFIKATFSIGKKYGLEQPYTLEGYRNLIKVLFYKYRSNLDILFDFEPGFDFKGVHDEDKFSIEKISHDEKEAKTARWAQKERGELSKLSKKNA